MTVDALFPVYFIQSCLMDNIYSTKMHSLYGREEGTTIDAFVKKPAGENTYFSDHSSRK